MLARLQQLIAATLLALTIAAVAVGAAHARPWLAAAFVALVLLRYAAVLAIETLVTGGLLRLSGSRSATDRDPRT